jgi:hypothetical protein
MLTAGWVNFFFLPEVINREWAGRGLLAWAHTHLVTPLRRRSADPAAAAACVPVTLQVLLTQGIVGCAVGRWVRWVCIWWQTSLGGLHVPCSSRQ